MPLWWQATPVTTVDRVSSKSEMLPPVGNMWENFRTRVRESRVRERTTKRLTMLQDTHTIRHYQHITDALNQQWDRGYRTEELRLYLDGYLAALRHSNAIEPLRIHRLEEEATRYLYDYSNFITPHTELDLDYK